MSPRHFRCVRTAAHTPHGKSEPQKAKRGVHRDPRRPRLRNARRACGDQVGIELVEAPRRVEIKPRPEKQQRGIDRTPHRRGQLRDAHALRLQCLRREVGKHFHRSAVVLPAEERTMPKASQAGHTQLFHTREIGPSPLRIRVIPHLRHAQSLVSASPLAVSSCNRASSTRTAARPSGVMRYSFLRPSSSPTASIQPRSVSVVSAP